MSKLNSLEGNFRNPSNPGLSLKARRNDPTICETGSSLRRNEAQALRLLRNKLVRTGQSHQVAINGDVPALDMFYFTSTLHDTLLSYLFTALTLMLKRCSVCSRCGLFELHYTARCAIRRPLIIIKRVLRTGVLISNMDIKPSLQPQSRLQFINSFRYYQASYTYLRCTFTLL